MEIVVEVSDADQGNVMYLGRVWDALLSDGRRLGMGNYWQTNRAQRGDRVQRLSSLRRDEDIPLRSITPWTPNCRSAGALQPRFCLAPTRHERALPYLV